MDDRRFDAISGRVRAGQPLLFDDGVFLLRYPNLPAVTALAHWARTQRHGKAVYYNRNIHLNVTNVCEARCRFCSFSRPSAYSTGAYTMMVDEALDWLRARYAPGITEVHIVNGLNPDLPLEYYEALLGGISREFPALHIKAFTAVEIDYFASQFELSCRDVLQRLMAAGLDSIPGGGAEVFSPRVRMALCPRKSDGARWLEVHRVAHRLGLRSNCTMLYGTIETLEERVDHLIRLRSLQEETSGFQCFVPLAFQNRNNPLQTLPSLPAEEHLRLIAVSRLLLHNIPHIKAYWVVLGLETARQALRCGADDIDGTLVEERVCHRAGASTPESLSGVDLRGLIRAAGLEPVERTSLYGSLSNLDAGAAAAAAV